MTQKCHRSEGQVFDFFVKRSITCPRDLVKMEKCVFSDKCTIFAAETFVLNEESSIWDILLWGDIVG